MKNTRIMHVILTVALIVCMVPGCERAPEKQSHAGIQHSSFRDIPGVTEDEIKAIEVLRKQTDVLIFGLSPSTEAFIQDDGAMGGYSARLCDWLTKVFEMRFQPRLYAWNDVIAGLSSHEIHFTSLMPSAERLKTCFMSDPIAASSIKIMRVKGSPSPDKLSLSRPVRYVFLEGSAAFQAAAAALAPGTYEAVFAVDHKTINQMLRMGGSNGGADAFIGIHMTEGGFDLYHDVVSEDFLPLIFVPIAMSTKNPALEPIISIVTKALRSGAAAYLAEQHKAGREDYEKHKFVTRLSDEEKAYLQNHAVVPFASQYSSYPLSFFNTHEKKWEGIVFEILDELTKLTGLGFELVNDQHTTMPGLVKILESGRAYLVPQLIRTPDRDNKFIWSKGPYLPDRYALLSKWAYPNVDINDIPLKRIGLTKNTAFTEIFRSWFPHAANTKEYPAEDEAFHALDRGEVDMVMSAQHRLIAMTNYYEFSDYKVNFLFNHTYVPSFAFNKEQAILCSIIDKALTLIDTDIIVYQWMSKTYNYRAKLMLAQRPWLLGAIGLLLFIFILFSVLFRYKHYEGIRLKKLTNELTVAEMKAKNASEAKSSFLASMSHEIRTPMNAILGVTELQLQNEMLAPSIREAFGMIYNSGDLLLGIVNDILDLSRIETGKLDLAPVAYEVASLINDTVQLNMVRIGSKQLGFELDVDENTPSVVVGDVLRVKQILNNVLSNAFKYTAQGLVKLVVAYETGEGDGSAKRALPALESGQEAPDVTLVFTVSDTGEGMTAEQLSRLFDEYVRFNRDSNRMIEGAGLGMPITRNLLRLMNGEIFVESEVGKGSTFTVRLPQGNAGAGPLGREVAEQLRQFRVHSAAQRRVQIRREPMPYGTVLVVDDVETNLYVAKGLLASYALTVDTAASGLAAIEKIKEGKVYDVVFMDHMMPGMNGIEATEAIRGLGYTRPVVALTANAMIGRAEMFRERGFDDFIAKPIDLRQMNEVLNKFVRDVYPPELVEAARRQAQEASEHGAGERQQTSANPNLAKIFLRDASKSLALLETLCAQQDAYSDTDIRTYVISIHGIKGALANIGELELSSFASTLEQAGRAQNIAVMSSETPAFLNALRAVIEKTTPKDHGEDRVITDEERAYLREKLRAIQAACAAYNKKAAKAVLSEIEQKPWPRPTRERLDAIAEQLLHSKFKAIVSAVSDMIKE